jgi:hypothetical protein
MLACFLTILSFAPVVFATTAIEYWIKPDELTEIGIRLETSHP